MNVSAQINISDPISINSMDESIGKNNPKMLKNKQCFRLDLYGLKSKIYTASLYGEIHQTKKLIIR